MHFTQRDGINVQEQEEVVKIKVERVSLCRQEVISGKKGNKKRRSGCHGYKNTYVLGKNDGDLGLNERCRHGYNTNTAFDRPVTRPAPSPLQPLGVA